MFQNLWLLLNFEGITLNSILVHRIVMSICRKISQCRLSLHIFCQLIDRILMIIIFLYSKRLVIIRNFTLRILLLIVQYFLIHNLSYWRCLFDSRCNIFYWIFYLNSMHIGLVSLQLLLQFIQDHLKLFFIQISFKFWLILVKIFNFILLAVWTETDLTYVPNFSVIVLIEIFMIKNI